jgi:hypothetical protein
MRYLLRYAQEYSPDRLVACFRDLEEITHLDTVQC